MALLTQNFTMRGALSLFLALGLTACAVAKNPLTKQQISALDIVEINVAFEPDVNIAWSDGRAAFAALKGCERPASDGNSDGYNTRSAPLPEGVCDYEKLTHSPEAEAFLKDKIIKAVTGEFNTRVRDKITGSQPAHVNILFEQIIILSKAQGFILGGQHFFDTGFTVVETKTDATIATYPDLIIGVGPGMSGFMRLIDGPQLTEQPLDALSAVFANFTEKWLTDTLE